LLDQLSRRFAVPTAVSAPTSCWPLGCAGWPACFGCIKPTADFAEANGLGKKRPAGVLWHKPTEKPLAAALGVGRRFPRN